MLLVPVIRAVIIWRYTSGGRRRINNIIIKHGRFIRRVYEKFAPGFRTITTNAAATTVPAVSREPVNENVTEQLVTRRLNTLLNAHVRRAAAGPEHFNENVRVAPVQQAVRVSPSAKTCTLFSPNMRRRAICLVSPPAGCIRSNASNSPRNARHPLGANYVRTLLWVGETGVLFFVKRDALGPSIFVDNFASDGKCGYSLLARNDGCRYSNADYNPY